jgi:hypothetical protein
MGSLRPGKHGRKRKGKIATRVAKEQRTRATKKTIDKVTPQRWARNAKKRRRKKRRSIVMGVWPHL